MVVLRQLRTGSIIAIRQKSYTYVIRRRCGAISQSEEGKLVASSIADPDLINSYFANIPVSSINRDVSIELSSRIHSNVPKVLGQINSNVIGADGVRLRMLEGDIVNRSFETGVAPYCQEKKCKDRVNSGQLASFPKLLKRRLRPDSRSPI